MSKLVQWLLGLKGYGGSTFPGYFIEKLAPKSVGDVLSLLPGTVVVVTGTNGKTTTTKMVADMLSAEGKKVFTNNSGSNFVRGILAQIVKEGGWRFRHLSHDIAVLELDEAYGPQFVQYVRPDYVVALNIFRDQLDRFGEIDNTSKLIGAMLRSAKQACIVNGNEPELVRISKTLSVDIAYYAVVDELREMFPTDAELLTIGQDIVPAENLERSIELISINGQTATYVIEGKTYPVEFKLRGMYNFQNAAAALLLVRRLLPDVPVPLWLEHLQTIQPAFGRGEVVAMGDRIIEIVLVKNPAGFQQALLSYRSPAATMVAINDNYADGRDISWLWDVDCGLFATKTVHVVAGLRAFDMALRLQYDNVTTEHLEKDVSRALKWLLRNSDGQVRIFCNYTAMLQVRSQIAKLVHLERLL